MKPFYLKPTARCRSGCFLVVRQNRHPAHMLLCASPAGTAVLCLTRPQLFSLGLNEEKKNTDSLCANLQLHLTGSFQANLQYHRRTQQQQYLSLFTLCFLFRLVLQRRKAASTNKWFDTPVCCTLLSCHGSRDTAGYKELLRQTHKQP